MYFSDYLILQSPRHDKIYPLTENKLDRTGTICYPQKEKLPDWQRPSKRRPPVQEILGSIFIPTAKRRCFDEKKRSKA